jgi:succinylglutamate desuccinylase
VIAARRGAAAGPTLIVIGGVHGNEPAGIAAARAVLGGLAEADVIGEVIGLVGNVAASALGRRQLARDLNRMWTSTQIVAARAMFAEATAEDDADPATGAERAAVDQVPELRELAQLGEAIDVAIARARGPVFVLDLHTTSAPGFPFAVVGATEAHRRFAQVFQLPGILGLEEALPGVLSGYYGQRGCVTLAIEGGQHASPVTADNLTAIVTLALEAAGVVRAMPGAAAARAYLAGVRGGLPPLIEVAVRHAIRPEHAFRMEPGFANLHRTAAGTLLARDASGEIRAPFDGVVLLPLYQPDGDDGFFYGRAVG